MTTSEAIDNVAASIVLFVSAKNRGKPPRTLSVLFSVARALGCQVKVRDDVVTSYTPEEHGDDKTPEGVIALSAWSSGLEMARELVHEICHHIIHWWGYWRITTPEELVDRLADDAIQERICRAVEERLLPPPEGLTVTGKFILPEGSRPIFWTHQRRPVPSFMNMSASDIAAIEDVEF